MGRGLNLQDLESVEAAEGVVVDGRDAVTLQQEVLQVREVPEGSRTKATDVVVA